MDTIRNRRSADAPAVRQRSGRMAWLLDQRDWKPVSNAMIADDPKQWVVDVSPETNDQPIIDHVPARLEWEYAREARRLKRIERLPA